MTCPLCNGNGKRTVIVRHALTKMPITAIDWCLCTKAKFVVDCPDYKLLKRLNSSKSPFPGPEAYLPFDQISPKLKFNPDDLRSSPNLLIHSDPEEWFFFHLKSIIMMHRFDQPIKIRCCTSLDLLKDFYVQQGDGSNPQLADLNKYDLLVFTLDNREKNDQLKTCVAQVVHNRLTIGYPTWIVMNQPSLSACTYEYSNELEEYIKQYESVSLVLEGKKNGQSKKSASSLDVSGETQVLEIIPEEPKKKQRKKHDDFKR
jgi:hypothetical protein